MATCLWWMGEPDAAVESGERARAIAASLADTALEALTAQRLGQAYATLGEHRRAIDILTRQVERPRGEPASERFGMGGLKSVTSRAWMAWCFACLGEFTAGIRAADEAVRIAEAVGDPYSLGVTYAGAGLPHLIQGNLVEATSWFERSVDICRRASFMPSFLLSAGYLGQAYTFSGRIAEALELLERVTAQSASIKVIPTHVQALGFLSEAQFLAGRRAEALESANSALRLIRAHRQRFGEPEILRVLGDLRVSRDCLEVDEAEEFYTQALTLAREMGLRPLVARCHLHLGRMYGMAGKRAQGHEHLTSAKELFLDMQMRFWLEKADVAVKEWCHGVD
jgi:tetratricopeptide (TPR) repeat protein